MGRVAAPPADAPAARARRAARPAPAAAAAPSSRASPDADPARRAFAYRHLAQPLVQRMDGELVVEAVGGVRAVAYLARRLLVARLAAHGALGVERRRSDPSERSRPGDVFVDVGANEGYYTVLGARIVGEHGHVYALEPGRETFEQARAQRRAERLRQTGSPPSRSPRAQTKATQHSSGRRQATTSRRHSAGGPRDASNAHRGGRPCRSTRSSSPSTATAFGS